MAGRPNVTLDPYASGTRCIQKPYNPASWIVTIGNYLPVGSRAFSLYLRKPIQQLGNVAAVQHMLRHLFAVARDNEVTSQVDRLSSKTQKLRQDRCGQRAAFPIERVWYR